jgi:hypothetical protein
MVVKVVKEKGNRKEERKRDRHYEGGKMERRVNITHRKSQSQ